MIIIYFIIGIFISICRFIIFMCLSSMNYKITNKHLLLTKQGWISMLSNIICDALLWPLNVLWSIKICRDKEYCKKMSKYYIIEE